MNYNEPKPPHNAFFQIWIYWGLPGILSFLYMLYVFSRAIDKKIIRDRQKTSIYIFMIIIPVVLLFYPMIYHKAFAVGAGLMLATRFWHIFETQQQEISPVEEKSACRNQHEG